MAEMSAAERKIREERASVYTGMSAFIEKLHNGGEVTVEDRTEYDAREARLTELDADLARIEKHAIREAGADANAETRGMSRDHRDAEGNAYERAYSKWFVRGDRGLNANDRAALEAGETRDDAGPLSTVAGASAGEAGYLIPQGFWHNLQIALKAYGGVLPLMNVVHTDTGNPMPWPTTDPTNIVGSYLTENTQMGFQDFDFGQGMMHAWTIVSNVVLASIQIINDSAFNVDNFVSERIGESIGRKIAAELHNGSGTDALLGVQTALAAVVGGGVGLGGVFQPDAGGVVNTLNSYANPPTQTVLAAKVPSFADILEMVEFVDPAYRAMGRCQFVFSSGTLSKLRSICDGFGRPLWNPSVQVGQKDDLYGWNYTIDQNAGEIGSVANTKGGLLFGDLNRAMVVRQVNQAGTMRLTERYADFLQVGFLGYVRMDARSNDLRAAVIYETPAS